jgi:hypothetical protein
MLLHNFLLYCCVQLYLILRLEVVRSLNFDLNSNELVISKKISILLTALDQNPADPPYPFSFSSPYFLSTWTTPPRPKSLSMA